MSQISRKQIKKNLKRQMSELRDLFCDWDPLSVMVDPEWPRDEYDCLIGPVLSRLTQGASEAEIADYLRKEFNEHFGVNSSGPEIENFARRIKSWFQGRWPEA
jgi:hypothetical protein